MFDVSQQADEVALEGLRHSHHRLYFAADSTLEPLIEEALGGVDAGLIPDSLIGSYDARLWMFSGHVPPIL